MIIVFSLVTKKVQDRKIMCRMRCQRTINVIRKDRLRSDEISEMIGAAPCVQYITSNEN